MFCLFPHYCFNKNQLLLLSDLLPYHLRDISHFLTSTVVQGPQLVYAEWHGQGFWLSKDLSSFYLGLRRQKLIYLILFPRALIFFCSIPRLNSWQIMDDELFQ